MKHSKHLIVLAVALLVLLVLGTTTYLYLSFAGSQENQLMQDTEANNSTTTEPVNDISAIERLQQASPSNLTEEERQVAVDRLMQVADEPTLDAEEAATINARLELAQ